MSHRLVWQVHRLKHACVVLNNPIINELEGVTVTQGGDAEGTLKTTLNGATTSVVITATPGITFLANVDVVIGIDELYSSCTFW